LENEIKAFLHSMGKTAKKSNFLIVLCPCIKEPNRNVKQYYYSLFFLLHIEIDSFI
jgi:hypothetical protein